MKDAREIVEPRDLVLVHSKFNMIAGICKQWTDKTFQYFKVEDYSTASWIDIDDPEGVNTYLDKKYSGPSTWTRYIRNRVGKRVVPIEVDLLNEYEKVYYERLKEKLNL